MLSIHEWDALEYRFHIAVSAVACEEQSFAEGLRAEFLLIADRVVKAV
jgi:hypothetical protein